MRNEIIVLLVAANHHNANSGQNLASIGYKIFTLCECLFAVQILTLILLLCFIPPVSTLFKNKITLYNISANFCKIVKVSSRKIRQQTAKYLFIFIFIESQLIDFTFDTG